MADRRDKRFYKPSNVFCELLTMKQKGTTMIELIIALSITVFVMVVLVYSYIAVIDVFRGEMDTTDIEIESSRAMEIMVREIRELNTIQSAASSSITFWGKDLNLNGTADTGEIITYSWDGTAGGNILRTVAGAQKPIARHVNSFVITYDNPAVALIRKVDIKVVTGNGNRLSTKDSSITPRNL